ncbi:MAG TPA: hypothetical protein PL124_11640 [Candidatus Cloacimonadota bacterium]|nr:hypothetical protein [Candidatus Cloacimonadota bacterium]HPS40060.1 hypothetical protein [Candidatus Cloacimonadota bacterium]
MADIDPVNISLEDYNKRISAWGTQTGVKIRSAIRSLTSKGKGDLLRSLRAKSYKFYGEVDRIAFHFVRHGVFLHKGVGRGYAMIGGKVMRVSGSANTAYWKQYARSKNRSFEPKVLRGTTMKREPVEWFNPVVSDNIDKLADMVSEMRADQTVNATKILIR